MGRPRLVPPPWNASNMVWWNVIPQPAVTVVAIVGRVDITLVSELLRQFSAEDRVCYHPVRASGLHHNPAKL